MTPEWVKKIVAKVPIAREAVAARNSLLNGLSGNPPPKQTNSFADPNQRKNLNPNPLGTPRYK